MTADAAGLRAEVQADAMDPARALALAAVLGHPWAPAQPLPPFFHRVYFWEVRPDGDLGRDGHPRVGGLIPDFGLPRRMWAGGRLEFHRPLFSGQPAERRTVRDSALRKQGRSGPLGFVTLRHEIRQNGALCVTEWQDLVYREEARPDAPHLAPPPAPEVADETRSRAFNPVGLMRYSGLTMNGHRIHYDADYARDVEGYPGLVVHAPLLAQLMMLMAPQPLKTFRFRAVAPLCLPTAAVFGRLGNRFWVAGPGGGLRMEGEAG